MRHLPTRRFVTIFLAALWSSIAGSAHNSVTLGVNLGVKNAEGLFDPASDQVVVRGSFNGWPSIVLQRSSSLSNPDCRDVDGSAGLSRFELAAPAENVFFRLRK